MATKSGVSPPTYLRAASYRRYGAPVWFAGSSKDDFQVIPESPPESRIWPMLVKTNPLSVNIACYLDNRGSNAFLRLLPLPRASGQLENLNAYLVRTNSAGAVLAEGPRLIMFDALYGPGETIDSPPSAATDPDPDEDLDVPDREWEALDTVIFSSPARQWRQVPHAECIHATPTLSPSRQAPAPGPSFATRPTT